MTVTIEPCIWFDEGTARNAVETYLALIPDSRLDRVDTYENSGPDGRSTVLALEFELTGRRFQGIDAARHQQPNPSISLKFGSSDRDGIERLGRGLLDGGFELMPLGSYPWSDYFGWVADRYGVAWQLMLMPDQERHVFPLMMFVGEQYGRATDAIEAYTSIFPDSRVDFITRYPEDEPDAGTVQTARFELIGEGFAAMDSGYEHQFAFNDLVSFAVMCDGQQEVDRYWNALLADGGEPVQCGWLKDRFGVSWQVMPRELNELLRDSNRARADAVMRRMLQMVKIDIATLEAVEAI